MILADKIINLRKKSGMSQEELADKLNVSRQSVSKWEGAQSIPDLERIIALGKIFNVSTDFLLKDEIEFEDKVEMIDSNDSDKKKVTMEMANDYLSRKFQTAKLIAFGVLLCILSPLALIVLGGLSEYYIELSENVAAAIGLVILFVMVTVAVCLFLIAGNKTRDYNFITEQIFETEYGVTGMVKQKKKEYDDNYFRGTLIGIVMCILCVVPLLIAVFTENEKIAVIGVGVLLVIAAIGVFFIVYVGCKNGALISLLQEGDYSKENKQKNPIIDAISGAYWLVATIIYLVWSFLTNSWEVTWIVWVVAGILYAAIFSILYAVGNAKNKQ